MMNMQGSMIQTSTQTPTQPHPPSVSIFDQHSRPEDAALHITVSFFVVCVLAVFTSLQISWTEI
jgi:hypothetical protein